MRRPSFHRRLAPPLLAALLAGTALAQGWSVQTVALRDLREAKGVVAQLEALGFDAFTEFAMHDGEQYVRVRVGCYTDRSAAQAAASALSGHITKDAVVVTLASASDASGCVKEDIGFLEPAVWKDLGAPGGLPTFSVEVGGHQAKLVYTGAGWRVVQGEQAPAASAVEATGTFVAVRRGGVVWVAERTPAGERMLCPGTLVGQAGSGAVVERPGEVVACRLVPVTSVLANGAAP